MGEPPPIPTIKSARISRAFAAPFCTQVTTGLGVTSSNTSNSCPFSLSVAHISAREPFAAELFPVTINAHFPSGDKSIALFFTQSRPETIFVGMYHVYSKEDFSMPVQFSSNTASTAQMGCPDEINFASYSVTIFSLGFPSLCKS